MLAYRRQKTVGEKIIRAQLYPAIRPGARTRDQTPGYYKCRRFGGRGCAMCAYTVQTDTHTSAVTGESFPIQSYITCTSNFVLYDIWCDRCRNSAGANPGSDQYTGKSQNQAAERFSQHKSDVNTGKVSKAVAHHFTLPGHKTSDMRILPFEIIQGNDPTLLASRETYWIQKKKTFAAGMNRQK